MPLRRLSLPIFAASTAGMHDPGVHTMRSAYAVPATFCTQSTADMFVGSGAISMQMQMAAASASMEFTLYSIMSCSFDMCARCSNYGVGV